MVMRACPLWVTRPLDVWYWCLWRIFHANIEWILWLTVELIAQIRRSKKSVPHFFLDYPGVRQCEALPKWQWPEVVVVVSQKWEKMSSWWVRFIWMLNQVLEKKILLPDLSTFIYTETWRIKYLFDRFIYWLSSFSHMYFIIAFKL